MKDVGCYICASRTKVASICLAVDIFKMYAQLKHFWLLWFGLDEESNFVSWALCILSVNLHRSKTMVSFLTLCKQCVA